MLEEIGVVTKNKDVSVTDIEGTSEDGKMSFPFDKDVFHN